MREDKRLTTKDFKLIKNVLKEYSHHLLDMMIVLPDDAPEIDDLYQEFSEITKLLEKLF